MSKLETRRFDAKLDSFLRRRLAQEEFERISTSEPCVVLSPDDKRVHRHAVLSHRCLYLTEVPPKNVKVALHLKNIHSLRMVSPAVKTCQFSLQNKKKKGIVVGSSERYIMLQKLVENYKRQTYSIR